MMRTFSSLLACATLTLTAGLIGCSVDPGDPFDTLTSLGPTTNASVDGDGDGDDTSDTTGDGDGDPATGDGDGDPTSGDGDGDTGCPAGTFGCPCDAGVCDEGLSCDAEGICGLGGDGDGDGDPTTGDGDGDPWDPNTCQPPGQPIGVDGIEGGFCSEPCTVDADCPAGPPGTNPACALQTPDMMTYCALVCDPANDACTSPATCKDVPNQPGVGLCTYP